MPLVTRSLLTEYPGQRGQPIGVLLFARVRHQPIGLHDGIDRRRFRDDDVGGERREHLRDQGRAAARHVKDQPARPQMPVCREPFRQSRDRRRVTEQLVERLVKAALDAAFEERIGQPLIAEMTPVQIELVAPPGRRDRQPARRRQRRLDHIGLDPVLHPGQAHPHPRRDGFRVQRETAPARALDDQRDEAVAILRRPQLVLQRLVAQHQGAEPVELVELCLHTRIVAGIEMGASGASDTACRQQRPFLL